MHGQIGSVVLGSLSAVFAGYGARELALAYRATGLQKWTERAAMAAASVFVAAVFAVMTLQILAAGIGEN